jgi:hypothetical protein
MELLKHGFLNLALDGCRWEDGSLGSEEPAEHVRMLFKDKFGCELDFKILFLFITSRDQLQIKRICTHCLTMQIKIFQMVCRSWHYGGHL